MTPAYWSQALLHGPADVFRWLLVQMNLGSDPTLWETGKGQDWPVQESTEPDQPDNCITVYDTTPRRDARMMTTGETYYHWGMQIRIRAQFKPYAAAKVHRMKVFLDQGVDQATVVVPATDAYPYSAQYLVPACSSNEPIYLGSDSPRTKRYVYTLNVTAPVLRIG